MPDILFVKAYSFPQGEDRTVEHRMWHDWYAQQAYQRVKIASGVEARFDTMVMSGQLVNVMASAMTFRGIEQLIRPLPYLLAVPSNLVESPDEAITGADQFFSYMVQQQLGVNALRAVDEAGLWVIVDPHLLNIDAQQQMASLLKGRKVLMILPVDVKVPPLLIDLVQDDNEVILVDAVAPFAAPMLEEALFEKGEQKFTIVGAGERLFPTIFGVCDAVLQRMDTDIRFTNAMRRQLCDRFVRYAPLGMDFVMWCDFDESWYHGQSTVHEAAMSYLAAHDFLTDPVQPDHLNSFNVQSEFAIAPYWLQV